MKRQGKITSNILISVTHGETRVALLEGGQVAELYVERAAEASLVGNIYKGRVMKILPGMQSAFIDIGLDKAAFLYVGDLRMDAADDFAEYFEDECPPDEIASARKKKKHDQPIEEMIQEGQDLVVQVSKDPLGTKGARVTTYITIPGRYVVLMPNVDHVGVSRRISNEEERHRLKATVEEIKPGGVGLIIRTASESATREELKQDLDFLHRSWENIQSRKSKVAAPTMLYSDLDLRFRSVRDLMSQDVESLVIDSEADHAEIVDLVNTYFPKLMDRIELYKGTEPLFEQHGIELDISRALDRRVWLKSGGYIVLDQTEAMTVIDVNTGKYVGKEDLEDTILKTNLEAVKEIAYQIRLRNLGGIIIVDFIDMEVAVNRDKVFHAFQQAMSRDRAKSTIFHITELGLIQMTRKRVRESLGRTLCNTCPYCEGRGIVKSTQTVAYEIIRKIQRAAAQGVQRIIVSAHPLVAELLSDEEGEMIEEIERKHRLKIIVTSDGSLHQENYDVSTL